MTRIARRIDELWCTRLRAGGGVQGAGPENRQRLRRLRGGIPDLAYVDARAFWQKWPASTPHRLEIQPEADAK